MDKYPMIDWEEQNTSLGRVLIKRQSWCIYQHLDIQKSVPASFMYDIKEFIFSFLIFFVPGFSQLQMPEIFKI